MKSIFAISNPCMLVLDDLDTEIGCMGVVLNNYITMNKFTGSVITGACDNLLENMAKIECVFNRQRRY